MFALVEEMRNLCIDHHHYLHSKHIAVILKNSRPVTEYVYNYVHHKNSIHAEMAAIINYMKIFNKCFKKQWLL